jgi:hypothetical protein
VTSVEPLDKATLAIGGRYRITQPRLRPAIWSVVRLEPPHFFSWESRPPGVRTLGSHSLSSEPGGATRVMLQIDFSGPLSLLVGMFAGRLTNGYLAREAAALKQRVEASA